MGGGVSSLSKVCILAPSSREDADIDYTFAQVQIREAAVDYRGNCGNMSSAVGPFAVNEGLLHPNGDSATVRIFNTNTSRIIRAQFPLTDGRAATEGPLAIPGVAGTGAPVRLDFLTPGGASTGRLLPTGRVVDRLEVAGHGPIEASLVDAANACVFVRAADLGLRGDELPDALEANTAVLDLMQRIRRAASVAMGIAANDEEAGKIKGHTVRELCRAGAGRRHALGRAPPFPRHRPDGTLHLKWPAAPCVAADRLAVHQPWQRGSRAPSSTRCSHTRWPEPSGSACHPAF